MKTIRNYSANITPTRVYQYDYLTLDTCYAQRNWFVQTLDRRKHELININDIISLTDNPKAKHIQDKKDLIHSINDLIDRIASLNIRIKSLEGEV